MNLYSAKADSAGNFKVALPVQNAGTSISITAADSKGNVSKAIIIKVQRVAPNRPTVNPVNNKSTSVSGITEGNAMVTVKIGTKTYTTKADANGNYKVNIPVQYEANAISITAKDSKGNVSAAMETPVVRVAPNIPDVDADKSINFCDRCCKQQRDHHHQNWNKNIYSQCRW